MRPLVRALLVAVLAAHVAIPAAQAIVVTPTQNATTLANALVGGGTGIVVTSATLLGHRLDFGGLVETSSGTFTNGSGTYGIGAGIVLSTGAVENYGDGPNELSDQSGTYLSESFEQAAATPAQELLLDPITTVGQDTFDHFDVTELILTFDMQQGFDAVRFNVVFGSEEFPEYAETGYFDGFGLFLNGTNVAFVAGQPVNITHPDFATIAGTELDGLLAPGGNPLLTFGGAVNPTGNTLRFIIGDREDSILDSTVYISALRGTVPEPGAVGAALVALAMMALRARSRR
jgi:hypothetical protein